MKVTTDGLADALRQLSPERLLARIDALDAERAQLMVLLRSVRARERAEARGRRPAPRAKPSGGG